MDVQWVTDECSQMKSYLIDVFESIDNQNYVYAYMNCLNINFGVGHLEFFLWALNSGYSHVDERKILTINLCLPENDNN